MSQSLMWGPALTVRFSNHLPPVYSRLASATVAMAFSMTSGAFAFCIAEPLVPGEGSAAPPIWRVMELYPRCADSNVMVARCCPGWLLTGLSRVYRNGHRRRFAFGAVGSPAGRAAVRVLSWPSSSW